MVAKPLYISKRARHKIELPIPLFQGCLQHRVRLVEIETSTRIPVQHPQEIVPEIVHTGADGRFLSKPNA